MLAITARPSSSLSPTDILETLRPHAPVWIGSCLVLLSRNCHPRASLRLRLGSPRPLSYNRSSFSGSGSHGFLILFFFRSFGQDTVISQPGIEPVPPALEPRSLNHWTTREVPASSFLVHFFVFVVEHILWQFPGRVTWKVHF